MFLYAYRSNYAASHIDWNVDLLLGDRSIVTSYICRWTRFPLFNSFLVFIVNCLEHKLPAPDYILYLDVPHYILRERLSYRKALDVDETDKRSKAMRYAYDMLQTQEGIIKRIASSQWYRINGNQPEEAVCHDALNRILSLLQSKDI